MGRNGKKYSEAAQAVEERLYELPEAVALAKKLGYASFDESLDMALRLGVDPRHADQMVRGTVALPHGTGKTVRVLVFASGEKIKEAEDAGADFAGGEELAKKIEGGWLDFDAVVSTPDMMKVAGKLGRVLGPRGLMPNPKAGTVSFDVGEAVRQIKAGKIEYRVDKTGIIHAPVGKLSFSEEELTANAQALVFAVLKGRPASSKGKYFKSVTMSSTMGPAIPIDDATLAPTEV